jgi:Holliday junction resolvasome RuvABC endonuclease subunit
MVQILLRLEDIPTPDDAADALAIAICGSGGLSS